MCCTTSSRQLEQAHTCAYRKGGLARAVHPTSGRGIVQNPLLSLTDRRRYKELIHYTWPPAQTHAWASWPLPCVEGVDCPNSSRHRGAGVTSTSPHAALSKSGIWAASLQSRTAEEDERTSTHMFGKQKAWYLHSSSQHHCPGKVSIVRDTWTVTLTLLEIF